MIVCVYFWSSDGDDEERERLETVWCLHPKRCKFVEHSCTLWAVYIHGGIDRASKLLHTPVVDWHL